MLNKLKKIRKSSVREIRVRGRQSLSAFAEQIGWSKNLPADAKFWRLFDANEFGGKNINAEILLADFRNRSQQRFFAAFESGGELAKVFAAQFGTAVNRIIERAERAAAGKFDLLGYTNLDFGVPVNWCLEPLTGKEAPQQHWKKFDELDAMETGDKKIVWELNRQQHFFTLGAAYRMTRNEKFAAAFVMHLTGWMSQNPVGASVNWISSLEIALRSISWIWGLHFFQDSPNLSPAIFTETLKYLYAHGRHIEKYLSTFYSPNTHLTGEALGLYYLGTQFPGLKTARRWRKLGARILLDELDRQLLPDGVYFEQSTWYHRYTIDFYTHFLLLSQINNDDLTAHEREKIAAKLQSALDFLLYTTRPDGTTPLIGDDDGGLMLPCGESAMNDFRANLATGAILFGRGDYKFAARDFAEESFWLLGDAARQFAEIEPREPAETAVHFADGGYFAARTSWRDDADFLLVDGGKHGALTGGHAHADALAFELAVNGRTTLVDAGTYSYHESAETRDDFRVSAAHNTLTINGASASVPKNKFSWESVADAVTESCLHHPRFDYFAASHNGFSRLVSRADGAVIHKRQILTLREDYWILRDEVQISGTHECRLNFHFAPDSFVQIGDDETFVINSPSALEKNDGLKIFAFGENGAWSVADDWIAPCYGVRVKAQTAHFTAKNTGRQEFYTFLLPTGFDYQHLRVKEIAARGGRGFVIDCGNYRDWLIVGEGGAELIENEMFGSNFRFAWARFDNETKDLEELVLINGSRFVFNEAEILRLPKTVPFVAARRINGELRFENFEDEVSALSAISPDEEN